MVGSLLSVLASVAAVMASTPPPAGAFAIGVSTEAPASFASPYWQALGIRRTRYVAAWDAVDHAQSRATLDSFLGAARSQGIEVLVAFSRAAGSQCPARPCSAPTPARYAAAFRAFHRRYPWVKLIQPWNEINNPTQPTYSRPDLAAAYYNTVKAICPSCTVPAADLQDVYNFASYLKAFKRAVHGHPTLWGLHNYTSVNRFRDSGTKLALKLLPGRIWLTETGGIYTFRSSGGVVVFPPSANRSARAVSYLLRLTTQHRARLPRLYIYQWDADPTGHFDAGLVDLHGRPRQAYTVLTQYRRYVL
ncbi:MAG: hypothetical protein JWN32_449 [Solirubrobacterales bacterium]|nr:hypothetical protein [Solirubrobacterales bacterium]